MSAGTPFEPERYELRESPRYRFELDRRDFLRLAGGGLVVVLLVDRAAESQESGRPGRGGDGRSRAPEEIAAYLRIAPDGTVTVNTGKAEVGQGIRTSLTQAVAEELRVPPASIALVMADTALTPYDMGTFGSRTTPSMSAALRRVAAAAREALVDLAAGRLGVDRGGLEAAGGAVAHAATGRSVTYGDLAAAGKLVRAVDDGMTTPASKWTVLGQALRDVRAPGVVTGAEVFVSDVKRPGLLHGKVLRPPASGSTLASADTGPASAALPGAVVVRDGDFVGAAAPDEAAAARAISLVKAEWKPAEEAPAASRDLFAWLKKNASQGEGRDRGGSGGRETGSVEAGLAAADVRLEQSYTVATIAHVPLEPRAAVAEWEGEKLTVWTGTQRPFGVRSELARAFRVPEEGVRVICPATGAGYGGKHTGDAAIEAARLARAAKAPVRVAWTREEEFSHAYFRPAALIEVRSGARKDGTLTAWEFRNWNSGSSGIETPYEVANRKVAFQPTKNPVRQGSYRALAATANHFARESHMDELAAALGIDPLEFRLRNLKDERLLAVLRAAAEKFGWSARKDAPGRASGLACGLEKGGYVATCAEVAAEPGGKISVLRAVTAFECGAIVNPDNLRNQVEGAVIMGLGGALFEAVEFEGGKILNGRLSAYRVPRFADVPAALETVLVDRKDLDSAGAGETPIVAIAPAIANAVFAASGKRLRSMPLSPQA